LQCVAVCSRIACDSREQACMHAPHTHRHAHSTGESRVEGESIHIDTLTLRVNLE